MFCCRPIRLVSASRGTQKWSSQRQCSTYDTNVKPIQMAYSVFESPQANKSTAPLIIMHGLLGFKQNWRGIARALATKLNHTIYTVDARNHGESPHTEEHTSGHMAVDLIEFMRSKGIAKANVMGHSMGGRAAMFLALKYPEFVNRAIVVDISPLSIPRDFDHMEGMFDAMLAVQIDPKLSMAQGRLQAEQQIKGAVEDKETADFILMNLRKRPSGEFYWMANVLALKRNLRLFSKFIEYLQNVKPYQGPSLFLCGNNSNYVEPESWPSIQLLFPNSEIFWLNAGHLVHFDRPAEFVSLVVDFLKK